MDEEKVKKAIKDLLIGLGEDPERKELKRTPERVTRLYKTILSGKKRKCKLIVHLQSRDTIL